MLGLRTKLINLFAALLKGFIKLVGRGRAAQISAHLSQQLATVVEVPSKTGSVKFFCPAPMPIWRAQTMMTKEPETIEWIDQMHQDDVLWDVGANVGVFSLYAASLRKQVLAFEPSPANCYLLSRNVEINGFDDLISSYCVAFNDETRLDSFYMSNTELGGALSSFGEVVDWKGESYDVQFRQAMLGFTIDNFIEQFQPPFPNHLKVDVDGIEKKIVQGAEKTLSDKRLKSVLIELNINLDECDEIEAIMKRHGLRLFKREHEDSFYSAEMSCIYNHIFVRES